MTISAERIQEIAQLAVDYQTATFKEARAPIPVDCIELGELAALAASGRDNLRELCASVEGLKLSPGDLLVVRTPADTPEAFHAVASALEAVAHAYNVRVLAIEPSATLEVTRAAELSALAWNVWTRLDDAPDEAEAQREFSARMIAEAAGELGLVILRARQGR